MAKIGAFDMTLFRMKIYHVLIAGAPGVGKTSFTDYMKTKFSDHSYCFGIETELDSEIILVLHDLDYTTRKNYDFNAIILVFDLTRRETFEKLPDIYDEIKQIFRNTKSVVLAGNKCDLNQKREVSEKEAQLFAIYNDLYYIETSAMNCTNVEELFMIVGLKITRNLEEDPHFFPFKFPEITEFPYSEYTHHMVCNCY